MVRSEILVDRSLQEKTWKQFQKLQSNESKVSNVMKKNNYVNFKNNPI